MRMCDLRMQSQGTKLCHAHFVILCILWALPREYAVILCFFLTTGRKTSDIRSSVPQHFRTTSAWKFQRIKQSRSICLHKHPFRNMSTWRSRGISGEQPLSRDEPTGDILTEFQSNIQTISEYHAKWIPKGDADKGFDELLDLLKGSQVQMHKTSGTTVSASVLQNNCGASKIESVSTSITSSSSAGPSHCNASNQMSSQEPQICPPAIHSNSTEPKLFYSGNSYLEHEDSNSSSDDEQKLVIELE